MRKTLLTSAALFGLGLLAPVLAQTPSAADQTAPGAAGTQTVPALPHHHIVGRLSDTGGQTWAHQPGTGESGPASNVASNIDPSDSRSAIAPHLPAPQGGENASPEGYLKDAQRALASHKTGLAQQALEMAETRLLDRSTPVGQASQPDESPEIQKVSQARQALGHGDVAGASAAIQTALATAPAGGAP